MVSQYSKNRALSLLLALFLFTALPTFFEATKPFFNTLSSWKNSIKELVCHFLEVL
jgi:hypothetical protein